MFEALFKNGGLSLERLRALVEVAGAGTIVRAAKGKAVRAGQYSRQIAELEQFFGIKLGERQGRRLVLNASGKDLACVGREVLVSLQSFQESGKRTTVTVTVGAY